MRDIVFKAESLSDRKKKNLSILDTIRRSGPISKTDISSIIGVNVVTVSNYVEEFLRQKLIFERELDVSKGGRRPVLLDLNAESGYAIGVGLNLMSAIAVLVDMRGKLVLTIKRDRPAQKSTEVVDIIIKLIRDLLARCSDYKDKIKGVGIGIAGIVDDKRETVRWPEKNKDGYNYSLITLPLKDTVEKTFNLAVRIDNDATVACFAEQWLIQEAGVNDLLYMFSGVGCGIMINGEIYRGASGCAGEMSIYNPNDKDDLYEEVNKSFFLRREEIDFGILDLARRELLLNKNSKIHQLCGNSLDNLKLKNIFEAAQLKDALALSLINKAAKALGIKIAFLVNLFNPQMVIIGGGLQEAGMSFIDEIRRIVSNLAFQESSSVVKIVPSRLGENAVALGAANLVVREVFTNFKE